MRIYYYCGVWSPYHKDVRLRTEECTAKGETVVNDLDWRKGIVEMTCPVCGTRLHQEDNHFDIEPFDTEGEKQ